MIDENDEIPQFVGLDENGRYPGSVAENLAPGAEVITVTAQDRDEFPDYKKVSSTQGQGQRPSRVILIVISLNAVFFFSYFVNTLFSVPSRYVTK